jgi:peptidoglycan/xylan/chitin deacetylase (PgdA/CDA1 family)
VSDILVLGYHAVSESWPSPLAVDPRDLDRHLDLLTKRGYRGATFSTAVLAPPAPRTVAITFDDAYRSVIELALPILARHGFPGTVFAASAFPTREGPMSWPGIEQWVGGPHESELVPTSWDELRRLAAAGWEIGSHTRTHARLTQLDDQSLAEELIDSRRDIEHRLETSCRSLAYPYGDHDDRVVAAAAQAGYIAACALPAGLYRPVPLRWPRIAVYRVDRGARLRLKLSPTLRRLRASRAWRPVLAWQDRDSDRPSQRLVNR